MTTANTARASTTGVELNEDERTELAQMLKSLNAIAIEDAVASAPRSEPDARGHVRSLGEPAGKMVRQLLFWEGKGQAQDHWIHKTKREWSEEARLSEAKVKSARRVLKSEGILKYEDLTRPSDQRPTTYYRLDMFNLARVVLPYELEMTERELACARHGMKRKRLEEKLANLRDGIAFLEAVGYQDDSPPEYDPFLYDHIRSENSPEEAEELEASEAACGAGIGEGEEAQATSDAGYLNPQLRLSHPSTPVVLTRLQ